MKSFPAACLAVLAPASASAGISNVTPNSFIAQQMVELAIPPDQAMRAFTQLPRWWNPDHSYSGKASNLTLGLAAGSCLCEWLPDGGSVEHMRVSLVRPGERLVMTGALGPLLFQGVAGVMDVQFQPTSRGTLVVMDYRVAGFAYSNAAKLAGPVDIVLGDQMARYKAFAAAKAR